MQNDSNIFWKKLSHQEITERVNSALAENQDFHHSDLLGVPASHLDPKVFPSDAPFLSNAPFSKHLNKEPEPYWLSHIRRFGIVLLWHSKN